MRIEPKTKDEARQEAIDWQLEAASKDTSYGELLQAAAYFERIGRKFGLLTEFRENGIL